MLETGAAYLRAVGPTYGFFGLGLCLYFASQGAGRLLWPLLAGLLRMVLAVGGGWLALRLTGSLAWVFVALGHGSLAGQRVGMDADVVGMQLAAGQPVHREVESLPENAVVTS